jgi:hypothetical protein
VTACVASRTVKASPLITRMLASRDSAFDTRIAPVCDDVSPPWNSGGLSPAITGPTPDPANSMPADDVGVGRP